MGRPKAEGIVLNSFGASADVGIEDNSHHDQPPIFYFSEVVGEILPKQVETL